MRVKYRINNRDLFELMPFREFYLGPDYAAKFSIRVNVSITLDELADNCAIFFFARTYAAS
jgi:hypothetical protein